jgi:hypothetical protein
MLEKLFLQIGFTSCAGALTGFAAFAVFYTGGFDIVANLFAAVLFCLSFFSLAAAINIE